MTPSRPIDIDILPARYKPQQVSGPVAAAVLVAAVLLFGLAPAYAALRAQRAQTAVLQAQLDDLKAALDQREVNQDQLAEIDTDIAEARARIEQLERELAQVGQGQVPRSQAVGAFVQAQAQTVHITALAQEGGVFTVEGEAVDQAAVVAYARALESSGRFNRVLVLSIVNADPQTPDVTFSIQAEQ